MKRVKEFSIRVPITQYQNVTLGVDELINVLEQELNCLAGDYDTIIKESDGKYYYYNRGYGRRNIGEKLGEELDPETLKYYLVISSTIEMLQERYKSQK